MAGHRAAFATIALAVLAGPAFGAMDAAAAARRDGQWVWCAADRDSFAAARRQRRQLVPAIWVATIAWRDGAVALTLAHPPTYVPDTRDLALVVRFDDSVHAAWQHDADRFDAQVAAKLGWILAESERLGVHPIELQLDYDAPVRRLRDWAALLRRLHETPLAGREVWITSLPAHLGDPSYGDWMRPWVAGHILQLFDTGTAPSADDAARLAQRAAAQRMPFRIGIGAFERGSADARATRHAEWIATLPVFERQPAFSGVWVFPGGMPWSPAMIAAGE
jgi:hypothetical protein